MKEEVLFSIKVLLDSYMSQLARCSNLKAMEQPTQEVIGCLVRTVFGAEH
jgi:hypothetical protein